VQKYRKKSHLKRLADGNYLRVHSVIANAAIYHFLYRWPVVTSLSYHSIFFARIVLRSKNWQQETETKYPDKFKSKMMPPYGTFGNIGFSVYTLWISV